jgi:hypothetical protein
VTARPFHRLIANDARRAGPFLSISQTQITGRELVFCPPPDRCAGMASPIARLPLAFNHGQPGKDGFCTPERAPEPVIHLQLRYVMATRQAKRRMTNEMGVSKANV